MNAAQSSRITRLLTEAVHPRTCPITGERYSDESMAELDRFGEPVADVGDYFGMLEIRLHLAGGREFQLLADPAGELWVTVSSVDTRFCPVTAIGWELVDDETVNEFVRRLGHPPVNSSRWAYVIREGDPIRDVLGECRAARSNGVAA